jgi:hypothetical protein
MHKKREDLPSTCPLIWLQILFTATNLLVPCNATGEILSVNQSCGGCLATPTNHFYRLVSSCMHVSSCTHKIITGYWVGPDIDDGWGFVEGFVNQITWFYFIMNDLTGSFHFSCTVDFDVEVNIRNIREWWISFYNWTKVK